LVVGRIHKVTIRELCDSSEKLPTSGWNDPGRLFFLPDFAEEPGRKASPRDR
jgi:hypothetical protein